MQATLYPPYGIRGFGPLRAVRYGLDDADSFIESSRQQLVRCVQIETKTAVKNLKEMVKNLMWTALFWGPATCPAP